MHIPLKKMKKDKALSLGTRAELNSAAIMTLHQPHKKMGR